MTSNRERRLSLAQAKLVLKVARERTGTQGLRDYAVLTLIHRGALKRDQINALDLDDYSRRASTLSIRAPHSGERIQVPAASMTAALDAWIAVRPAGDRALFVTNRGERLSKRQIQVLVKNYGREAGFGEGLHPEALRAPIPYDEPFLRDLLASGELAPVAQTVLDQLKPFRPKSELPYEASVPGRVEKRDPAHERLVNEFAAWLTGIGLTPGFGKQIDLGSREPPWIVEAEVVHDDTRSSWAMAIREAAGQLYEYRYFGRVPPDASLVFLASRPVPSEWLEYLQHDRGLEVIWRTSKGFDGPISAKHALGITSR